MSLLDHLHSADGWQSAFYRASWQGAIAIALAWLICRCIPRLSPTVRCWLWRLVLIKIALIVSWPGSIDLPWLAPIENQSSSPIVAEPSPQYRIANGPEAQPPGLSRETPVARPCRDLSGLLVLGWACGVGAIVAILMLRIHAARQWRRQCTLVKDADILTLCERLTREMGVYQPPVLFANDACESPVVFGALRTSIVLPARLVDQPDLKRLAMILRHELAHIRRGDLVWNWIATGVWGLFFFHPLVWLALRELRLSQELACDEWAVASRDASPADYGTMLLELANQVRTPSTVLVTVGVVESFEFLKRRLKAMKQVHQSSGWLMPVSVAVLSIAVVGLLPWRLVAAPPAKTKTTPAASAPAGNAHDRAQSRPAGADGQARKPLATLTTGRYTIAVEAARWAEGPGIMLVDSGFPVQANMMLNQANQVQVHQEFGGQDRRGDARGEGAAGGGGRAGGFAAAGGGAFGGNVGKGDSLPNLIIDLHVGGARNDRSQMLCNVVGKVTAKDDRDNLLESPEMPAHLKCELRGCRYPEGSGYTAVHLTSKDKQATSIKQLSGQMLVSPVKIQTTTFAGNELKANSTHRLGAVTVRLESFETTADGISLSVTVTTPAGDNPMEAMHNRPSFKFELEDSQGKTHGPQSMACGGGGSGGGAFAGGGPGGMRNQPRPNIPPITSSCKLQFAALDEGVTPTKLACTIQERFGKTQLIAFEFKNLPLP